MLTQELLKEHLVYDETTGIFTRKSTGNIANARHVDGYVHIRVLGEKYLGHRLAFLYVNGKFPENDVDHINGIRDDNRFCNLREATKAQNNINRKLNSNSTTGVKGLSFIKKLNKWRVQIQVNKTKMYFGVYSDFELAELVAKEAIQKYHKDFARQ